MLVKSWIPLQYIIDFEVCFSKIVVSTSILIILRLAISALVKDYLKTQYRKYIKFRLSALKA